MENGHGKTWSAKLYDFIRRLFRDRENFGPQGPEEAYKKAVRKEPDDILAPGEEEYACEPPRPSYTKGQTLLRRLQELKDAFFECLENPEAEMINNPSERALRRIRRKQAFAAGFHSRRRVGDLCVVPGLVQTPRVQDEPVFPMLRSILKRRDGASSGTSVQIRARQKTCPARHAANYYTLSDGGVYCYCGLPDWNGTYVSASHVPNISVIPITVRPHE